MSHSSSEYFSRLQMGALPAGEEPAALPAAPIDADLGAALGGVFH